MKNLLQKIQQIKNIDLYFLKQSMVSVWPNSDKFLFSKESFSKGKNQEGLKKRIGHRFGLNPLLFASNRDEFNYLIKGVGL